MSSGNSLTGVSDGNDPDLASFSAGVAAAAEDASDPAKQQEYEDVAQWHKEIAAARKFDADARTEYARNRKYCNATRGKYTVEVPIAPAYVDVLQSFLYARNPAVSIAPSAMTEPPPQKAIYGMVLEQFQQAQAQQQAQMRQIGMQAQGATANMPPEQVAQLRAKGQQILAQSSGGQLSAPGPQGPDGLASAEPPPISPDDPKVLEAVEQLLAPYRKQREDAKQFGQTMEIIVTHLWDKAMLKARAKMMVKSALSVGVGWIKAFWTQRMGKDPVAIQQIRDLQQQMANIKATRDDLESGESDKSPELLMAELKQQIAGLMGKVQIVVARGFVTDFIAAEDIQVSTEVPSLTLYRDACWIAHRSFITCKQAQADYPDLPRDKLDGAKKYFARKPRDKRDDDVGRWTRSNEDTRLTEKDADYYITESTNVGGEKGGKEMLCRWEVWDLESGNVLTLLEGVSCYAKPPFVPEQSSTRGHPFFLYCIGSVDGERHPYSMIARSESLFDEYNSVRSNYKEARRRAIPKTAWNRAAMDETEAAKISQATTGEMVGLAMLDPSMPLKDALVPIAYNNVDMALYDTGVIRAELEMIWGIQEALSSSIHTAKTATESEIQQQGTQSRSGYMSDDLDALFDDMAKYTAEIALQVLSEDDVRGIAGPFALWEPSLGVEDLNAMLEISIDAGSSGKPKTAIQQQAWATLLPMLKTLIQEIGQLLGSDPEEIADCLEELARETAKRAGDTVDIDQFLPDPPRVPQPKPQPTPPPAVDTALAGPQTAEIIEIAQQVAAGLMTVDTATGIIAIAYPLVPPELVQKTIDGALRMLKERPASMPLPKTRNTPDAPAAGPATPNAPDVPKPVDAVAPLPASP